VTDFVTPTVTPSKRLPRATTTAPSTRPADMGSAVVADATGSPTVQPAVAQRVTGVTVVRADQHTDVVSTSLHHGGGQRVPVFRRWTARTRDIGPPRVRDPVESGLDACGLPDPAQTNGIAGGTERGRGDGVDPFQTHTNGRPDTPGGLGEAHQEQDEPPLNPSLAAPERCTFLRADKGVTTRITPDQKHLPPRYRTSEAMIIDRREYPRSTRQRPGCCWR